MQGKEAICAKIDVMRGYYFELIEAMEDISLEQYLSSNLIRRGTERIIQLVIECATDINCMMLKDMGRPAPKDYFNSFIEMGEAEILPMDFVLAIAPSTGLRNILVHEYQKLDNKIVFRSVQSIKDMYVVYMDQLIVYLGC